MSEHLNPSIFDEIEKERPFFEYAELWQRLLNWIIDTITFFAFYIFLLLLILVIKDAIDGDTTALEQFLFEDLSTAMLSILTLYLLFYTLLETLLKGRTVGKLLTKTCAVRYDLSAISFKQSLMRSVARLLPFEVFSGFTKNTWHDRLSRTMVIKKGKRAAAISA